MLSAPENAGKDASRARTPGSSRRRATAHRRAGLRSRLTGIVRFARGHLRFADVIGEWATDKGRLAELAASFATAHPFPFVVIDSFFAPEVADRIDNRFPVPNGTLPEWQAQVRRSIP